MKFPIALRRGVSRHPLDIGIVGVALALLVFAVVVHRGHIVEVPAVTLAAEPSAALPANGLSTMKRRPETTPFSIDSLTQDGLGRVVIADHPANATVGNGRPVTLSGWAVDGPDRRAADAVYVLIDGAAVASCRTDDARADVAAAYGVPAYTTSGFSCTLPVASLRTGGHTIDLAVVTRGDRAFYDVREPTHLIVR